MLKVHGFSRVNSVARGNTRDLRVLWALEELQLAFELVGHDHPAHALETETYRALSPFEQIPAIVDGDTVISESGAIVIYLAKKARKLIPADAAGEAQVLRWCVAALNTIELPLLSLVFIDFIPDRDARGDVVREKMAGWAQERLGQLDRWLEGREFVATDAFTVADILMAHVLTQAKDGALGSCPRVRAYRERCFARPAWRRTIDAYCERVEPA